MTCQELLEIARREKPDVKYTSNRKGTAVAAWSEPLGRWQCVAMLTLLGTWAEMPVELLVDGKPATPQSEWING